jgi:DNA (cytosine-5)-methyltransferase 1
MKHLSLFTGYGGFDLACIEHGIESVGFSEIDKSACALLKYRYPEIPNFGDITKIEPSSLPDFDLLTGGFP